MKKRKNSSDNRLLPSIRRNEISRSSLNSYKRNKSNNNMNISRINSLFSSLCYFINENSVEEKIKREEEILYSPLVKSIKKSKILLSKSFNFDDHYSDTLDWYMMQDTKFTITDNIKKLGIKELTLEKRDFLITWSNGINSCIDFTFRHNSLSLNTKLIKKVLKKEVKKGKIYEEIIDDAIRDSEDQIIKKRDEIYSLNTTKTFESDSNQQFNSQFFESVSSLRDRFEKSSDPFKEWQQEVKKKYKSLKFIANKCFPDSWQLLQFCIAVKSIQNICGNSLPFVGFILYKPSSLKSTIIDLFQRYPLALCADDLTKSSFLSHYSTNSEDELQNNDLIPKMKNKILLTSGIAPIINANEDDLRKTLGIITRLVDGKDYQSHSGTHWHRSYPPMMFTWIGAGIEIIII